MTSQWYGEYYKSEYRLQMARFKGKRPETYDPERVFAKATAHGIATAARFRSFWQPGALIEVGSSVGGVLNGLRQTLGCEVFGIEPSPAEAGEANNRGIRTFESSIETFRENLPPAGNILCTQSLNHMLDPRRFLQWTHAQLSDGGRLFLEVMNFRHIFKHFGSMQRAIQIDHTYMFVPEVIQSLVEFAGFEVLHLEADEEKPPTELIAKKQKGLPIYHIALVAQRAEKAPFSEREKIRPLYAEVRAALAGIPDSRCHYFWRFRIVPKLRKFGIARKVKH